MSLSLSPSCLPILGLGGSAGLFVAAFCHLESWGPLFPAAGWDLLEDASVGGSSSSFPLAPFSVVDTLQDPAQITKKTNHVEADVLQRKCHFGDMAEQKKVVEEYEKLRKDMQDGILTEKGFHSKLKNLLEELPTTSAMTKCKGDFVIRALFEQGYTQKEMLTMLDKICKIKISDRHLRRILKCLGLRRRCADRPFEAIFEAVQGELQNWSPLKGIRAKHKRIRDVRGLQPCYRNDVHEIMRQLDKDGLLRRRPGHCKIPRRVYSTKGPNDTWHIDGNDKLRFYGIWIHLGIDGFSRRVLWLHAGTSNRKPEFIARYFIDAVVRENGCPHLVRADRGKENVSVAVIQKSFRYRQNDSLSGPNSFRYGKSVHNQRAECFNGHLKKSWICMWQRHFEAMLEADILELSNPIHIHCLQFCFLPIIAKELDRERIEWNNHKIRKQAHTDGHFGKPDFLFYAPTQGTQNQLLPVDQDLQHYAETIACKKGAPMEVANISFRKHCSTLLKQAGQHKISSLKEAMSAYLLISNNIGDKINTQHLDLPKTFLEACAIYNHVFAACTNEKTVM
ncbi:uncharacterized protein WCC33_009195 [Rhinophrynus dorsalis]